MIAFAATQLDDGRERIELLKQDKGGFFRRASSHRVPRSDWPRVAPASGMAALALARAADEKADFEEDELGVVLSPEAVARLGEKEALALGLPPATPLTLQLQSSGSIAEGNIAVQQRWVRRGGVSVRAEMIGARLREGSRTGRLAEPMRSAALAASLVNEANSPDERRAAFAHLREVLGDEISAGIEADGFIQRIRIAYAANFSLDAKTAGGRFDFDPILFGRQVNELPDGTLADQVENSLLTPLETQTFQQRFREQDGQRRSYLMRDGTLLFLDPLLSRALRVVRDRQKADPQTRRDFLRAPQRHLREALIADLGDDDEALDRLFIETQQFSDRVSGIEVWQKPVLPWIKPKPNSWMPESFGLRIGDPPDDTFVELSAGEAEELAAKVEKAIGVAEEQVDWKGTEVPASPATLAAARGLAELERTVASAAEREDRESQHEPPQIFFLQVGQNFETLDYARLPQAAPAGDYEPPALPDGVRSEPKPHQKVAFNWLAEAWKRKLPGVLLADDMGLGKTFQALLFLRWLHASDCRRPILIVAPTGLLRNWQAEVAQHLIPGALGPIVEAFGSGLRALRTGSGTDIRGGTSRLDVTEWEDAGLVLTTYETMRDYHMSFARVRFAAVVYDEAQKLKNPASQMTRAAKALNADLQLAMTGTPVENRLQDLWSITDVIYPGYLGTSREFEKCYPASDESALQALQSMLVDRDAGRPAFMLRRMKDEILAGLPQKTQRKYLELMPPKQAKAYDLVLARARALRQSGDRGAMLEVLHMLRGCSLHPERPRGISDFNSYIASSARLRKTFDILEEVSRSGEKALIFCEDLEMQGFLASAIEERFDLPHQPMCISGAVPGFRRQEMVHRFQSAPAGFDVMILSPKAGGVGLTITAANHVIHLSRWWNPAVEDQATDRVYRIGQRRPVTVHIPISSHPDPAVGPFSFDHRLDALMERKRALSRGLLMPPESEGDLDDLLGSVLDGEGEPSSAPALHADVEVVSPAPNLEEAPPRNADGQRDKRATDAEEDDRGHLDQARPILRMPVTPVASAEARTPEIRRVVFEQGGLRDWTIFEQHVRGASVLRMEVHDPYCCADDGARGRLVDFIARFQALAARIDSVDVVAFDADSLDARYPESNQTQRDGLERRCRSKLGDLLVRFQPRSRRARGDFHDRHVRIELEKGGLITWDLGRGIDGVMSARHGCVVNAYSEDALP